MANPEAVVSYEVDPSAEKWTTYKDYLKRKRDYKREWRKRKNPTTLGKRIMAQPEVAATHMLPDSLEYRPIHSKRKMYRAASPLEQAVEHLQPEIHHLEDARVQEEQNEERLDEGCNIIAIDQEEAEEEEEQLDHYNEIPEGYQVEAQDEDQMVNEEQEEHVLSPDDIEFTERWNTVYSRLISLQDTGRRLRYLKIIEDFVGELW